MRLFVALGFPPEVRRKLVDLIAQLKPEFPQPRWVRPEGMHVTLKFIGHVDERSADAIESALEAVHEPQPVEITFRGVGFFPDERRPRVVWCAAESSSNLAHLAGEIDRAVIPFGIERESRPFAPHVTLARLKSSDGAASLVRAAAKWRSEVFGSARETAFSLFESSLKPSGAEYRLLRTYPFVKGTA